MDMGNRFRMLVNTVEVVHTHKPRPKLPVARAVWRPQPNLKTSAAAWILAGGSHHTGFSQALTVEHLKDFAEMAGMEFLLIDNGTTLSAFKMERFSSSEQGYPLPTSTKQPDATWMPVSWKAVTIDDTFWTPHLRVNREQTLPLVYRIRQETGRIDNFRLNWKPGMEPTAHIFWDSDVAKWIEAASYSLATHPDPELEVKVDEVISLIVAAQQPDGYLNTYFTALEHTMQTCWSVRFTMAC